MDQPITRQVKGNTICTKTCPDFFISIYRAELGEGSDFNPTLLTLTME